MALSFGKLAAIIKGQLTPAEESRGVAYLRTLPVRAGTTLQISPSSFEVPWTAYMAFVDREPMGNWGHSCRYILVNAESGETFSIEARFPPFHRGEKDQWRIAFRASGVPDAALLAPE